MSDAFTEWQMTVKEFMLAHAKAEQSFVEMDDTPEKDAATKVKVKKMVERCTEHFNFNNSNSNSTIVIDPKYSMPDWVEAEWKKLSVAHTASRLSDEQLLTYCVCLSVCSKEKHADDWKLLEAVNSVYEVQTSVFEKEDSAAAAALPGEEVSVHSDEQPRKKHRGSASSTSFILQQQKESLKEALSAVIGSSAPIPRTWSEFVEATMLSDEQVALFRATLPPSSGDPPVSAALALDPSDAAQSDAIQLTPSQGRIWSMLVKAMYQSK